MSHHLPPRTPSTRRIRKHLYAQDIYQKPQAIWSSSYETPSSLSGSPLPSSSPPSTPYTSRHAHSYAYIRSSPEIGPDYGYSGIGGYLEKSTSSWDYRYSSKGPSNFPNGEAPFRRRASVSTAGDYPPTSDFDISELSDHDVPDGDSEPPSDSAPGQTAAVVSDSDGENAEGQNDDEDGNAFRFTGSSHRSTFFRTSAERGQWKYDPIPFKPKSIPSILQTRKSVPTLSRVPTPTLANPARPISEPAPSSPAQNAFVPPTNDQPDPLTQAIPPGCIAAPTPSTADDQLYSPNTVPSLSSDRESSAGADDHEMPASPLPPSSPPLSPMSFSVSILSRSVSPLSFAPDSPFMRSSSPLSELTDEEDDEDLVPASIAVSNVFKLLNPVDVDVPGRKPNSSPAPTSERAMPVHEGSVQLAPEAPYESSVAAESSSTSQDIPQGEVAKPQTSPIESLLTPPLDLKMNQDVVMDSDVIAAPLPVQQEITAPAGKDDAMEVDGKANPSGATGSGDYLQDVIQPSKTATLKSKGAILGASSEPEPGSITSASDAKEQAGKELMKEKRKKEQDEGPASKKRRTEPQDEALLTVSGTSVDSHTHEKKAKGKAAGKRRTESQGDDAEDAASEPAPPVPSKQKRRKRADPEESSSTSKRPAKSHRSKARRAASSSSSHDRDEESEPIDPPLDPETAALHTTVCGMVIETMAMSRASSLPVSIIYKMVMCEQPGLKEQRTEREWIKILERVLRDGEAGRGSGVFGKVESSGKDRADRPLEAQWFYVPELDDDQERATLIKSMMPRPAKRSETKKYKQYYWRPLAKMSRWDPEDEL